MAVAAGETIIAGAVPGERIATSEVTSPSSTFTTTATEVMSVTAPVVVGRIYRVRFWGRFESTVADDEVRIGIAEDTITGNEIQIVVHKITRSGNFPNPVQLEAEYTADATEDKTFKVSGDRFGGTGTLNLDAAASGPAYLYVDFIR